MVGAAALAGAAVRRFAGHVATYDAGVGRLNERWRSGSVTGFGAGPYVADSTASSAEQQTAQAAWSDDVAAGRTVLLTELRTELAMLEDALDTDADAVAALLDAGATPGSLADLFRSGDLPATDYLTQTGVSPTGIEATLARLIETGFLPPEAASMTPDQLGDYLVDNPDVARRLLELSPQQGAPGTPESDLAALLLPAFVAPGGSEAFHQERQQDLRTLFAGMDHDDAAILATLFPAAVGNTPGVPFAYRAVSNRTKVIVALDDERARLQGRLDEDADNEGNNGPLGWNSWDDDDMDGAIEDSEGRIALYESILADDRRILVFDPSEDGAIAELHGTVGPGTDNVGVLLPGTGTDMGNIQDTMDRSQSFVDHAPDGGLAMITWMGGDLPDSVAGDAPYNHYTDDLAPSLVGFSDELGDEIDSSAGDGASVTVAGHSYGGAVVGIAETRGLETDRVLHVASAGMGHDVQDTDDLPDSQSDVDRYSMTAPGDNIEYTQGVNDPLGIDRMGHGADPDTFPGTVRLATGNYADGTRIEGGESHSGVLVPGSDAWLNMYEVLTGGTVAVYEPSEYTIDPYTGMVVEQPDDDPPVYHDIE